MNKYDFEAVEKHIADSQKFLSEIQKGKQVAQVRFTHFPTNAPMGEQRAHETKPKGGRRRDTAVINLVTKLSSNGKGPKEISRLLADQGIDKSPAAIGKILARAKRTKLTK